MKLAWMLLLAASVCNSMAAELPKPKKAKRAAKSMPEWIALENSKKTPCENYGLFGVVGGGTNGYDSWSVSCENGVEVYKDTTAETQERQAKENARKDSLAKAFVTRCLNAKEMAEVTDLGYRMYVREMQPFLESEMQDKFHAALLTQQLLQMHCPAQENP